MTFAGSTGDHQNHGAVVQGRTRCGISGISFQEYGSCRPLTPRNSELGHFDQMQLVEMPMRIARSPVAS
jgi:hypothetical protein